MRRVIVLAAGLLSGTLGVAPIAIAGVCKPKPQ